MLSAILRLSSRLSQNLHGWSKTNCRPRAEAIRRRRLQFTLERLEDRTLLSDFTAANVSELIAAIDASNQTPEADTIALAPGTTFTLTEVINTTNGATGLPTIAPGQNLTIRGNGGIIERSAAAGTSAFRLFDVAEGASLLLENMTLQGGNAHSTAGIGQGGAIRNQGALTLHGVTVQGNLAQGGIEMLTSGSHGLEGEGGGIYSSGSLAIENSIIQNNQARGGFGFAGGNSHGGGLYIDTGTVILSRVTLISNYSLGANGGRSSNNAGPGGNALGGGLYIRSGIVSLTQSDVSSNSAIGGMGGSAVSCSRGAGCAVLGDGGDGGAAMGGGLFVAGGDVTLNDSSITRNAATGRGGGAGKTGGAGGNGIGAGLYVASGTVNVTNVTGASNSAQGGAGGSGLTCRRNKPCTATGAGGDGGDGSGGGAYVAGGAVYLRVSRITENTANGGDAGTGRPAGRRGRGIGGGLFIESDASVCLDAFTEGHVERNQASTHDYEISGRYANC